MSDMTAPNVDPADLFPFEAEFVLRGGDTVLVTEFTLRQRDAIADVLKSLGEDDAAKLVQDFLGFAEDDASEGVEIAVVDLVKAVASKVAEGVLSRLLAICLDTPRNRKLWTEEESTSLDWVLDHVSIRDEPRLLAEILRINDLKEYLGNLWNLTGMEGALKAESKDTSETDLAEA